MGWFGESKEEKLAKAMIAEFNAIIGIQITNAMIVKMIGLDTNQKIAAVIFFDYLCHIFLDNHAPRDQVEATLMHSLNLFDKGSFNEDHISMTRSLLTEINDPEALQLVDKCKAFITKWNKGEKNQTFLAELLRGNIISFSWQEKYYDQD